MAAFARQAEGVWNVPVRLPARFDVRKREALHDHVRVPVLTRTLEACSHILSFVVHAPGEGEGRCTGPARLEANVEAREAPCRKALLLQGYRDLRRNRRLGPFTVEK